VVWTALVVFGVAYLISAVIYAIVNFLAVGERARAFKAISPGILSPMGIVFGLYLVFTGAQVWSDIDRANAVVSREADALNSVIIFSESFPGAPEERMRALVRRYIKNTAEEEWPMMAPRAAKPAITPPPLAEALQLALSLTPEKNGQETAQRGIISALDKVLDARRERIAISLSQVNWVKWFCLVVQALCLLLAIAMMHNDNRVGSALAMGLFATGVGVSILLIASHNRPFTGEISVGPYALLQVLPEYQRSPQIAVPVITWACIFALIGPGPNWAATALAAASVAASRRLASRASISLRSGEPWHNPMTASRGESERLNRCSVSVSIDENPASPSALRISPMLK
jgi:hypothetical protein